MTTLQTVQAGRSTGPPSAGAGPDGVLAELEAGIGAGEPRQRFLARVDRAQRVLYEAFRRAYGVDGYAKLLALKTANLAVGKYHFAHRHTALASKPVQLMVDPSNTCQLQCPGCVHSASEKVKALVDWPGGLIDPDCFGAFVSLYAPFAWGAVLYNYGEPMLNKRTPEMIRRFKRYLVHTAISSNLSLKIDAEALVRSGLNCLYASLDGATQEVYGLYRRRGRIEVCYENLRNIVAAKRRLGIPTPYIEWKYLTFQHNEHEVDLAIEIAHDVGVDEIHVATPFAVDWDDPSVQVAESPKAGRYKITDASLHGPLDRPEAFAESDETIERAFATSWLEHDRAAGGGEEPSRAQAATCRWLYQSVTLDAVGRIHPCCMPPVKDLHRVYGIFPDPEPQPFNARDMKLSRLAFADRPAYEEAIGDTPPSEAPFCAICKENPGLTYTVEHDALRELRDFDPESVLSWHTARSLTEWAGDR